ncbi:MAG: hypothetical protein IE880_03175, partial [Epsilonproteobacteria bacterium]|nr:hypothetical protein [Campylobacterota bacterium]
MAVKVTVLKSAEIKRRVDMLIFGHPLIQTEQWFKVNLVSSIGSTTPNCTIVIADIEKYADIAKHCKENSVDFACEVSSIKQAVIANA